MGEDVLDLSVYGCGPVAGCFKQNIDFCESIKCGEFYCDSGLASSWVQTRLLPARKYVAMLFVRHINYTLRINDQIMKKFVLYILW